MLAWLVAGKIGDLKSVFKSAQEGSNDLFAMFHWSSGWGSGGGGSI